jgi:ATP-dependent protease ClpP protease subunit
MEIFLYGEIGYQVRATEFIQTLKEATSKSNEVTIAIDSVGGDVFQGLSIYNAIQEEIANGKVITAHVKALAASAASFIAISCSNVIMNSYSMMMIHKASGYVRKDSDIEAIQKINKILIDLYAKKTGLKDKALDNLLDKEHWMTAEEAVAEGFADKVVEELLPAEAFLKMEKVKELMAINNKECETEQLLVTAMAPFYKTGQTDKKIQKQSMLEINNALKLEATATEAQALEAIVKLEAEAKDASSDLKLAELKIAEIEKELKAKDEKIAEFQEKAKADLAARATEIVEAAFKAGKISEDQKADYLELAKTHFEKVKNIIDKMSATNLVSNMIKSNTAGAGNRVPEFALTPTEIMLQKIAEKNNNK